MTNDVDVIARVQPEGAPAAVELAPPEPLPEMLVRAIANVARGFDVPADWMNTEIAAQWLQGMPSTLPEDVTWRLRRAPPHLSGKGTPIAWKLFAAAGRS